MSLTHAVGRIDPMAVARAIGPQTARIPGTPTVLPKHPNIHAGNHSLGRALETHLQFEIEGGLFLTEIQRPSHRRHHR